MVLLIRLIKISLGVFFSRGPWLIHFIVHYLGWSLPFLHWVRIRLRLYVHISLDMMRTASDFIQKLWLTGCIILGYYLVLLLFWVINFEIYKTSFAWPVLRWKYSWLSLHLLNLARSNLHIRKIITRPLVIENIRRRYRSRIIMMLLLFTFFEVFTLTSYIHILLLKSILNFH